MANKKLIVFCDGTWNKPDQKDERGNPRATNVEKLFRAVCQEDFSGHPQIVHYVRGVGTRGGERLRGGAFGFGISTNIKDGYQFICSNYDPGDEIFLFGFSRGAYTARSLAGLIHNMGILKREHFDQLDTAYDKYRDKSEEWHPNPERGTKAKEFRDNFTYGREKIRFIGVWDTVGALGSPYGLIMGWLTDKLFKTRFHDAKLSRSVESGYHALAIHERRWPFRPTLWELDPAHDPEKFGEQWFDGVHSDVGGGSAKSGLADIALEWMKEMAKNHGMKTDLSLLKGVQQAPADPLPQDSQAWYYRWPTLLMVKWPALVFVDWPGTVFGKWPGLVYGALNKLGIIAEPDIAEKIARIRSNGDYIRR